MANSKTTFVILSHGRSGSTTFVQLLSTHPSIHCEGESFNKRTPFRKGLGKISKKSGESLIQQFGNFYHRKSGKPIVGFKVFPKQFTDRHFDEVIKMSHVKKMILWRQRLWEAAISAFVASRTRVFGLREGESHKAYINKIKAMQLRLDQQWIENWILEKQRYVNHWRELMGGTDFLELHYENLFTRKTIDRVTGFLGTSPIKELKLSRYRMNTNKVYQHLVNFDEVKKHLKNKGLA